MNKNYEAFRNNLMYTMRSSGLEFGAMYYIFKDVLGELERMYSNAIQQEMDAEAQAQREADEQAKAEAEAIAESEADAGAEDESVDL